MFPFCPPIIRTGGAVPADGPEAVSGVLEFVIVVVIGVTEADVRFLVFRDLAFLP